MNAQTEYTTTEVAPVVLAGTTYAVSIQDFTATGDRMVWLTGPRGATYFLREYANLSGRFQVISWKSGAPLTRQGNAVEVVMLADVIERATAEQR